MCRSEGDQCCSVDYVEGVQGKVRERLERFLRREFEDVIEEYQDEVDNLLECEFSKSGNLLPGHWSNSYI